MVNTEIYIEGYKLELSNELSTEFNYAIDDINDFGAKNTSFSKTINIAGNATNNRVFGFIFDLGNANNTDDSLPNVNYNFNVSKAAQCRIFIDKIQVFKGTLRILEIIVDSEAIEYQCSVFGELGGFINELSNLKLEDLDFSAYNHLYTYENITASWEASGSRGTSNSNIYGSGYYYPLIDYGAYSTLKTNYNVKTFRPALFAKEYLEKIISDTGYTFDFPLLNTDSFKRLIIPHNQKELTKVSALGFAATSSTGVSNNAATPSYISFPTQTVLGSFVSSLSNTLFTYSSSSTLSGALTLKIAGTWSSSRPFGGITFNVYKNGTIVGSHYQAYTNTVLNINLVISNISFTLNDTLRVGWTAPKVGTDYSQINVSSGSLDISSNSSLVGINYNETVTLNSAIPKGIFQKDFFLSICKMFNLYVYDDIFNEKKIYIKPYVDFYPSTSTNALNWSNKIDRSKPLSIKPMSELNARYYQFKYKDDADYYNENYKKKYNQNYGDRLYDTTYDFSKDTESLEVIFASSPLIKLAGKDKYITQILKLSDNDTKEQRIDSVIRIMQVQKITGVTSWTIRNQDDSGDLVTLTSYGYAGHLFFDNSGIPTQDINFGAPKELYFTSTTYPTTNLFNAYYSDYMAEITSKNSKLLTCYALLNTIDINSLDFSKLIWIDGVLFRLNNIEGFNPMQYNTSKISLLKVIETNDATIINPTTTTSTTTSTTTIPTTTSTTTTTTTISSTCRCYTIVVTSSTAIVEYTDCKDLSVLKNIFYLAPGVYGLCADLFSANFISGTGTITLVGGCPDGVGCVPSTTTTSTTTSTTTIPTTTTTTSTTTSTTTIPTTTTTTTLPIIYTYYVATRCDNPSFQQFFRTTGTYSTGTSLRYNGFCWEVQAVQGSAGVDAESAYIDCMACNSTFPTTTTSTTSTTTTSTTTTTTTIPTTTTTTTIAPTYTYYVAERCDNPSFTQNFRTLSTYSAGTSVRYNNYCWSIVSVQGTSGVDAVSTHIDCAACASTYPTTTTSTTTTTTSTTTTTTTASPCTCKQGTIQDNNAFSYTDCAGVFQSGSGEQGSEICVDINEFYSSNIGNLIDFAGCSCS
jgi:hypothetical protein